MTSSLRAEGRDTLAALRAGLAEAGYTEELVASLQRRARFLPRGSGCELLVEALDQRLQTLARLLALGRPTPIADATRALAPISVVDLETTGLLTVDNEDVVANYVLVPYGTLLLAGDAGRGTERDVVAPYMNPSVVSARLTPREDGDSLLDLGTGSGVLALLAAEHCRSVTGVDINPHALAVARLNAHLNRVDNVRFVEGSWFEPVGDATFDLIVSNPPYVLSPDDEFTYRDSGLPGTALIQQLCEAIPHHLRSEGLGIVLACWPHTGEDDWATVPIGWVTDTSCDALVIRYESSDSFDHAVTWNTSPVQFLEPDRMRETIARWVHYYHEAIAARVISFGAVIIRRRATGPRSTKALTAGSPPGERAGDQLVRLFRGQDLDQARDDRELLAKTFSLPDGLDIRQRFQRREARFTARAAMVRLEEGLGVSAALDPDALDVLFRCDGQAPLGKIVEAVAARRGDDVAATRRLALGAVRELLTHGLLVQVAGASRN